MSEATVEDRLDRLGPRGWLLLNDVRWPGRPQAVLDHVLVGPGGVVVVDDEDWAGEVSVVAGVLWQGRFARTQSVERALAQCAAITSILAPPFRRSVRPLICIAGQPDLFGITDSDVAVAGADRAVDAILALPSVLSPQTVAELYEYLNRELARQPAGGSPASPSRRKPRAWPNADGGGMTHLLFLGAFVVFAVYVLPYWGR